MKYPCVFADPFIKEQVNPRLYAADPKTPFGAFQKAWRQQHCATINPYGSESCPYPPQECAMSYLMAAEEALLAKKSRIGLFRAIAKTWGIRRADEKPLAREEYRTSYGQPEAPKEPRPKTGLTSLGSILGEGRKDR